MSSATSSGGPATSATASVPRARRRGLATWALGQMLGEARALGLDRVLIVCEAGNVASAKTIERQGGVLEEVRATELGTVRRYWITL